VLYNGVDTGHFSEHAPISTPVRARLRTRYIIGSVGRMRPEKAHLDLVRITGALRSRGIDVGLLLVGDGPERARVIAEIERLRLTEAVFLAGETRDVRPLLNAMDLFVLPSVETFSNAALESLASAVPVVCARGGGMDELIGFGGGVSCEAGDIESFATTTAGLLCDESERRRLAIAARSAALEHFDWDRAVDRFIALVSAR
jgi:glycosyltransferase involved in cell wall biosynthesis